MGKLSRLFFNKKDFLKSLWFGFYAGAVLLPLLTIWFYLDPWDQAIEVVQKRYPDQYYIPVGYRSHSSSQKNDVILQERSLKLLMIPANITMEISQTGSDRLVVTSRRGGLMSHIILILILYGVVIYRIIDRRKWRESIRSRASHAEGRKESEEEGMS